jgi:hypothetical protein
MDWQNFNFLENLFLSCAVPERSGKENGIKFHISPHAKEKAICLLFKTDQPTKSLVRGFKPDYMTLYIEKNNCICTLIEMKDTQDNRHLRHGIKQLIAFKNKLQEEINHYLPDTWQVHFQGILLTPPLSDYPIHPIRKEAKENGFIIVVLQYHKMFELLNYVSKLNKLGEPYKHQPVP